MFDLMNAVDATNYVYEYVEKEFNKHPEWDGWLQKFDDTIMQNCCRIVRLDGLRVDTDNDDVISLRRYMKATKVKKTRRVKVEVPLYKKAIGGKQKLVRTDYEYQDEEYEIMDIDPEELCRFGKSVITLLKLKGYEITDVTWDHPYRENENDTRVLKSFVINLGGKDGSR